MLQKHECIYFSITQALKNFLERHTTIFKCDSMGQTKLKSYLMRTTMRSANILKQDFFQTWDISKLPKV